ncbi:MAG TPA: DUF2235 domain-containing protein [Acidimicrobiia bacterium]|nr:DUF2235 domain-containing protein [Acidimicrobiia bacterium]
MGKNIVVCLDGTGNQLKATANSNVLLLYSMLDLSDPERQVGFYHPGVGTMGARGAWTTWGQKLTKLLGLAFGFGIKANLEQALAFLIQSYHPGDQVFIFGFSRGAFTARGLTGLTYRSGVMRKGAENLVPYLVAAYSKGNAFRPDDWKRLDRFAETFSVKTGKSLALPVHFLGLWDSVKALGILRPDPKWPYTRQLPNARHIFHAVSIDERRRPYAEYLVKPTEKSTCLETWFAGVHSDVGGGFVDHPQASRIALKWMADRALDHGLLVSPRAYRKLCTLTVEDAAEPIHGNGKIWGILGWRGRPITTPDPSIHQSVHARLKAHPEYHLPVDHGQVAWTDLSWTTPHPAMSDRVDEPVADELEVVEP